MLAFLMSARITPPDDPWTRAQPAVLSGANKKGNYREANEGLAVDIGPGGFRRRSAADAHDFFLLPTSFEVAKAGSVTLRATIGTSFPTPEIAAKPEQLHRLLSQGAGNPAVRVVSAEPNALNLQVTGAEPGVLVAAVSTTPRDVDYGEDRIPVILGEYRVAPDAAAAVDQLVRPRMWRVSSRRFAKTILCVQRCTDRAPATRPLGADLEFVASGTADGQFRLLSRGSPLRNYAVDVVDGSGKRQHLATDAHGEVRLPTSARGTLMLFAAVLVPPSTGTERFRLELTSLTLHR